MSCQVGSSAAILWVLGKTGTLKVDPFTIANAKIFFWNAIAFMVLLYTNAKALESANVESVVVFRLLSFLRRPDPLIHASTRIAG